MPTEKSIERARRDAEEGKSPSTQAGEFVREEIHHVRAGKHGARSTKQAIAIGLSKARRAGVPLGAPRKGKASASTRKKAARDVARGRKKTKASPRRSRATSAALKREGRGATSRKALAQQARASARRRSSRDRSDAARRGARTRARRSRRS